MVNSSEQSGAHGSGSVVKVGQTQSGFAGAAPEQKRQDYCVASNAHTHRRMNMKIWIVVVIDSETHDWDIDSAFACSRDASKRREAILDDCNWRLGEPHPTIVETELH